MIPHLFSDSIAVREIELARRLTARFEVFLLRWRDALLVDSPSAIVRRTQQIWVAVKSALRSRIAAQQNETMTLIEPPVWQPILLQKLIGYNKSLALSQWVNRRTLGEIVQTFEITHLLAANELFDLKRISKVRTFYDIVDWFPEDSVSTTELRAIHAKLREISREVHGIFAVSEVLSEKLRRDCGIKATALPNGADLPRFRNVDQARVRTLRNAMRLEGKFVIGYIGNHGSFSGVDLVVNAFLSVRERLPEAVLLIVGPAATWKQLLASTRHLGVIATGSIPPAEMPEYFHAIDLGVLAQGRTTGTDFAFQIKVVEYSACRKLVVATPLLNWQKLAWPNVLLAEPDPASWAEAFLKAHSMRWQPEWDLLLEPYDWRALADRAADIMLRESPCAS